MMRRERAVFLAALASLAGNTIVPISACGEYNTRFKLALRGLPPRFYFLFT
jgi:hypothetical protein